MNNVFDVVFHNAEDFVKFVVRNHGPGKGLPEIFVETGRVDAVCGHVDSGSRMAHSRYSAIVTIHDHIARAVVTSLPTMPSGWRARTDGVAYRQFESKTDLVYYLKRHIVDAAVLKKMIKMKASELRHVIDESPVEVERHGRNVTRVTEILEQTGDEREMKLVGIDKPVTLSMRMRDGGGYNVYELSYDMTDAIQAKLASINDHVTAKNFAIYAGYLEINGRGF